MPVTFSYDIDWMYAGGGRHGKANRGQSKENVEAESKNADGRQDKMEHERQRVHAPVFVPRVSA
jgi:hypothetical protein